MEPLRLVCTDLNALPVVGRTVDGQRQGFDPDAAALVGRFLQRPIEWIPTEWWEMIPTVMAGRGDAVWCWLTPTPERERLVDFTEPYAFFDDAVLVRADSDIRSPENLRGRVVGVVSGGNSHRVASDRGAVVLPFFGVGDRIGQMVTALRAGRVEAVIDDDSTWLRLRNETDLQVAFSVPTPSGLRRGGGQDPSRDARGDQRGDPVGDRRRLPGPGVAPLDPGARLPRSARPAQRGEGFAPRRGRRSALASPGHARIARPPCSVDDHAHQAGVAAIGIGEDFRSRPGDQRVGRGADALRTAR